MTLTMHDTTAPHPPSDGSYGYQEGVLVTPAYAQKLIDANALNNRHVKPGRLRRYARDMSNGRWRDQTGETIKVSNTGFLIDGRNRLGAVVAANIPITFDIAWNVPDDRMTVIDSGSSRSAADALKVHHSKDRFVAASLVRWVINFEAGLPMNRGNAGSEISNTEIMDRYLNDETGFDAATARARDLRGQIPGITPGAAGTAYYLFRGIDEQGASTFWDRLVSGENLEAGNPIKALRNRLIRAASIRLTRQEQLALMIRAWNKWIRDERVDQDRHLQVSRGGLTEVNFPRPIGWVNPRTRVRTEDENDSGTDEE